MTQGSQLQAMDSYFKSLLSEAEPTPMAVQPAPAKEVSPTTQFAEPVAEQQTRLADLLAQVEPLAETKPVVKPTVQVKPAVVKTPQPPAPPAWKNIDPGREFQALFFVVSGVTFAVPLTELGGIHQLTKLNSLIGKPDWFAGVLTQRESQLNVVDTTRWIMPGREATEPYQYLVMLGNSQWGLACHELHGTELLVSERIQWRNSAGKRPWLAGMVKDKMCALLHVQELLALLVKGVNIEGL